MAGSRDAEAVDAGVVVAVKEDGVGWRGRLQPGYGTACNLYDGCNGPANVVEVQVGRGDIGGGASGDTDVVVLQAVRSGTCSK